MAKLPRVRVVRHGPWPEAPVLGQPPRSIPLRLWIRLVLGGGLAQVIWGVLAVLVGVGSITSRHPGHSPKDMSTATFIATLVLVCGPFLAIAGWRAYKQLWMLRHGLETRGTLVSKREVENSETSYWHYTFAYEVPGEASRTVVVVTEVPEPRLEDEDQEAMLYDPRDRYPAITLDHLPGYPQIADGRLAARDAHVWFVLITPVLTIATAAWWILR